MLCDIAPDRLHHVFWQYFDPRHPLYEAGQPVRGRLPGLLPVPGPSSSASLLELVPDDAVTIVMSDHGARPMMGGLCFNDWLIQEGYLTLAEPSPRPTPITEASIDWSRTVAWGDGGYYGRLFLNVKGREPQGIVEPASVRGDARRADRQARGRARPRRRAARHEGAEAAGRLPGGPRRGARPDRLLRRPRVAVGGVGRQPEPVHLRERHRPRRGQPRPRRASSS